MTNDTKLADAAPDLLAALRGALSYMELSCPPVAGTYGGDLIIAARAAIAKATGAIHHA
jgi:hypothetical protein